MQKDRQVWKGVTQIISILQNPEEHPSFAQINQSRGLISVESDLGPADVHAVASGK